jgi:septal ring factor EnvC (AmiA/AmiB activator)
MLKKLKEAFMEKKKLEASILELQSKSAASSESLGAERTRLHQEMETLRNNHASRCCYGW